MTASRWPRRTLVVPTRPTRRLVTLAMLAGGALSLAAYGVQKRTNTRVSFGAPTAPAAPGESTELTDVRAVAPFPLASDDFVIWTDFFALRRPPQIWVRADSSASVMMLEYNNPTRRVLSARAGQLDPQALQDIIQSVEDIGFFGLNDRYAPPSEASSQAGFLSVFVQRGDQAKLVMARPPDSVPPGLLDLAQQIERSGRNMAAVPAEHTYLRASTVEPDRAGAIAASGQFRFSAVDDEQLTRLPALRAAVEQPQAFIPAGAGEDIHAESFDAPYGYFFVVYEDTIYQVTMYAGT